MLLPDDITKLTIDDKDRLNVFFHRFCEGSLRRRYGLGHLVYACHASFPLILTPELANLIWVNFKHYPYQDGTTGKIDAIAVSDLLLSPLCRQINYQQYEILPQIRSYLLHLLSDGQWLRRYAIDLNGTHRLNQLADFLHQYIKQKRPDASQESTGFSQLNEWAALAYINPQELAGRIADMLEQNNRNNQGQLWLNSQMEHFEKQFSYNVHHEQDKKQRLQPFFNLYHYTQARKSEIFNKDAILIENHARGIQRIPSGNGAGRKIAMPLGKTIAERTNRRINVQRVLSLLIGVDEYNEPEIRLKGCVYGATQLAELLKQLNYTGAEDGKGYDTSTLHELYNKDATSDNIFEAVQNLFSLASHEDICLIYFSGHGENGSYNENTFIPADYARSNPRVITNHSFLNAIQKAKAQTGCQVVVIVDSHTGYYNWVEPQDVFIGAVRHTMQTEQPFDGEQVASAFALALRDIISATSGKITYRHLLAWLRFRIEEDYKLKTQTPVLQTVPANVDNYFLRTGRRNTDDAPVIVYNKNIDRWQVLEEDFKILTLNSKTTLRDYDTNERVPAISGELFVSDNILSFGGLTEGLDKSKIYKADNGRQALNLLIGKGLLERPEYLKISEELGEITLDQFSTWQTVLLSSAAVLSGINLSKDNKSQLSVNLIDKNYEVEFLSEGSNREYRLSWIFHQKTSLSNFIVKFGRFHYLSGLYRAIDDYRIFQPLQVKMYCGFQEISSSEPYGLTLHLDALSYFSNEGRITMKTLVVSIENKEKFAVFCNVYLLTNDLMIKKFSSDDLTPLRPGSSSTIEIKEPQLFEKMLQTRMSGQLKLLASYDPHLIDFSQHGIELQ
jgi:hypothetical protein